MTTGRINQVIGAQGWVPLAAKMIPQDSVDPSTSVIYTNQQQAAGRYIDW